MKRPEDERSAVPRRKPFKRLNDALYLEAVSPIGVTFPTRFGRGQLTGGTRLMALEGIVNSFVDANTDPHLLPFHVLKRMDVDPVCYLGEWSITGVPRKPDIYRVETRDDVLRAETEEWLWPLLPTLLPAICRSFIYGVIPIVLTWSHRSPLGFFVENDQGEPELVELPAYARYTKVHEVFPGHANILATLDDTIVGITDGRETYGPGQAHVAIWDRQFGGFLGQSARRRAWRYFAKSIIFELMQAKYLERAVDPATVVKAPGGTQDGVPGESDSTGDEEANLMFVAKIFRDLRGGGVAAIPSDRFGPDEPGAGEPLYEWDIIETPDRSEIWNRALNHFDAKTLMAYLTPAMLADLSGEGGTGRVIERLFSNFVEALALFCAHQLTEIVSVVHRANHSRSVPAPEIKAGEIPDKVQRLYMEVLKTVASQAEIAGAIDIRAMIDAMGVPPRPPGEPERDPAPDGEPSRMPGRPIDVSGDRQERREDARTAEGETDTGGPRDEDSQPVSQPEDAMLREIAEVCEKVALGRLTRAAAKSMIRISYPDLEERRISELLTQVKRVPGAHLDRPEPDGQLAALDGVGRLVRSMLQGGGEPRVVVNMPDQPAPVIQNRINVPEREVRVQVDSPQVDVDARPTVNVPERQTRVDVASPQVTVNADVAVDPVSKRARVTERDDAGRIREVEIDPE